jgi:hypothetical protein
MMASRPGSIKYNDGCMDWLYNDGNYCSSGFTVMATSLSCTMIVSKPSCPTMATKLGSTLHNTGYMYWLYNDSYQPWLHNVIYYARL